MKIFKRQSGQSLLEFALIFPIVFFLITGFIDLGRAVFYYSSLSNAVREATRYSIVHKDYLKNAIDYPSACSGNMIQNKVLEFAFGVNNMPDGLEYCDITVEVRDLDDVKITDSNAEYGKVYIAVIYEFKPITPGIINIVGSGSGIPLKVKSVMYISPTAR